MRWWTPLFIATLACGHVVLAQRPAPEDQEPIPTFRAGIEAVQFDVIVIGPDGQPVTDLTADDFELLENRSPQAITTFARVDIPPVWPRGLVEAWPVDPDVQTNDRPEGRVYLFALDEMRPDRALRTRAFLRQFLEEYFGPDDLAAVVLVGRGLVTSGHGFTSSPRRLLAAIDEFSGGMTDLDAGRRQCVDGDHQESRIGVRPPESVHMRNRVARIRELVEAMTGIPGGRKSILYFNECIGYDMFSIRDYTGGVLTMAGEDAHAAMAAATRGNVAFYTFDPSGLEPLDGGQRAMNDRMDLASLAHVTGGFSLSNSNNYADAFDRIVAENSTYYVLGFNSSYTRRDGRFVPVEVRVARPGVTVRAREGYVAPLRAPRGDQPAPASAMSAALANPLSTRGLPIRAVAAAYGGSGREAAVALTAEIDVSGLPLVARDGQLEGTLEISYAATDDRYRAYPGAVHAVRFSRPGDAGTPPPGSWVRLVTQLALPPGAYQLRVAAGSATRAGSVLYDLDVPDLRRERLALSGVSLTTAAAAAMPTLRPAPAEDARQAARCRPPSCVVPLVSDGAPGAEDPLAGVLPWPPTTARAFRRQESTMLFVEVYETLRRASAGHTLTVRAALRGEDGRVWPMARAERASTADQRPSGGYGVALPLPLGTVPPGRYLLEVEAHSDAEDGATVRRAVPISVL